MSRALVISGGGSKGAFAVGVIKKLLSDFPNLQFDIFVGTSTGSLIIPLVAMGEIELLEDLYTTQTTDKIIKKFNIGDRLNQHSIFDATPLWNLLSEYYSDENYNKLVNGGKKVYLTTTCLQTGELVVFTNEPAPAPQKFYETQELVSADHFRKAVMASACQPVFMPPVKVNLHVTDAAREHQQFVDGGVREYAGVQVAIDKGATEIFTILLTPDTSETVQDEYKTIFPILQRTIDIFTTDVGKNDLIIPQQYNEALEYIEAVKRKMKRAGVPAQQVNDYFTIRGRENPYEDKIPLKLFTIRPGGPLGGGPGGLTFDPEEMKGMVQNGELQAGDFVASLDPEDITWA
jgi:predicted acylesterase/phospholipase RssA